MRRQKDEALVRFGRAIRVIRKAKGFSQELLALESDVSRTYMGCLERGEVNVSLVTIMKLCAVLKVKPSEILIEAQL